MVFKEIPVMHFDDVEQQVRTERAVRTVTTVKVREVCWVVQLLVLRGRVCLPACDAVYVYEWISTFRRQMLPPSSEWTQKSLPLLSVNNRVFIYT
jgi:hypothetical protein